MTPRVAKILDEAQAHTAVAHAMRQEADAARKLAGELRAVGVASKSAADVAAASDAVAVKEGGPDRRPVQPPEGAPADDPPPTYPGAPPPPGVAQPTPQGQTRGVLRSTSGRRVVPAEWAATYCAIVEVEIPDPALGFRPPSSARSVKVKAYDCSAALGLPQSEALFPLEQPSLRKPIGSSRSGGGSQGGDPRQDVDRRARRGDYSRHNFQDQLDYTPDEASGKSSRRASSGDASPGPAGDALSGSRRDASEVAARDASSEAARDASRGSAGNASPAGGRDVTAQAREVPEPGGASGPGLTLPPGKPPRPSDDSPADRPPVYPGTPPPPVVPRPTAEGKPGASLRNTTGNRVLAREWVETYCTRTEVEIPDPSAPPFTPLAKRKTIKVPAWDCSAALGVPAGQAIFPDVQIDLPRIGSSSTSGGGGSQGGDPRQDVDRRARRGDYSRHNFQDQLDYTPNEASSKSIRRGSSGDASPAGDALSGSARDASAAAQTGLQNQLGFDDSSGNYGDRFDRKVADFSGARQSRPQPVQPTAGEAAIVKAIEKSIGELVREVRRGDDGGTALRAKGLL